MRKIPKPTKERSPCDVKRCEDSESGNYQGNKREAGSATVGIGKSTPWLRKVVADLQKRVLFLEKENKRLVVAAKKYQAQQSQKPDKEDVAGGMI